MKSTKLQSDFADQYKKLQTIICLYSNLYIIHSQDTSEPIPTDFAKFGTGLKSEISYPQALKEVISSYMFENNKTRWRDICLSFERKTTDHYDREELEEDIQNIRTITHQILHNFYLLIKSIIMQYRSGIDVIKRITDAKEDDTDHQLSVLQDSSIPHMLIEPSPSINSPVHLLILEKPPDPEYSKIKEFVIEHGSGYNALVLTLQDTLIDDITNDPTKFLEPQSGSDYLYARSWREPFREIEMPSSQGFSFADVIKIVISWVSAIGNLHTIIKQADRALLLSEYQDAIELYDMALEVNPRYVKAWYNKGLALSKLGQDEESIECFNQAIECFNQAIELDPKYGDAWNNKGLALTKLGKYEEAIACYNQAIELNPKYADAWNNKGLALSKLGRQEEAIACFNQAIE
ncbi:MAG: tetratricopeptide repeat protein, partial [Thermoproteota archaeon]|nr:tetratricopeptide repeat protein [Thermoproteota archaeon]